MGACGAHPLRILLIVMVIINRRKDGKD